MEEVPKEEVRLLKICVDQCTENSAATLMPIFEDDGCEIYYLEKFWFKINKKRLSDDVAIRKESSPFYGVHDQIEVCDNGDIVVGVDMFTDRHSWHLCATIVDADIVITNLERLHSEYNNSVKSAKARSAKKWTSSGSEIEIDEMKLLSTRQSISCEWIREITTTAKMQTKMFVDVDHDRLDNGYIEIISSSDERSLKKMLQRSSLDVGVQASVGIKDASTDTVEDTITYEDIALVIDDIVVEDVEKKDMLTHESDDDDDEDVSRRSSAVNTNNKEMTAEGIVDEQQQIPVWHETKEVDYDCVKTFANVGLKKSTISSLSWNSMFPGILAVAYVGADDKSVTNKKRELLVVQNTSTQLLPPMRMVLNDDVSKQGKQVSEEDVKYYNSIFKSVLFPLIGQNIVVESGATVSSVMKKKKFTTNRPNQLLLAADAPIEMEIEPVEGASYLSKDFTTFGGNVNPTSPPSPNLTCCTGINDDRIATISDKDDDDILKIERYKINLETSNVIEINELEDSVRFIEQLTEDTSEYSEVVESIRECSSSGFDDDQQSDNYEAGIVDGGSDVASLVEVSSSDDVFINNVVVPLYGNDINVDYDDLLEECYNDLPVDNTQDKVLIWNVNDELKPRAKLHYYRELKTIAFCPSDGAILAAGDYKGMLVLWRVDSLALSTIVGQIDKTNEEQPSRDDSLFWKTINGWGDSLESTKNIFRPIAVSDCNVSHLDLVTHIEWLPSTLQINEFGQLSNSPESGDDISSSLRLLSSSLDGNIKIWNIERIPASIGSTSGYNYDDIYKNNEKSDLSFGFNLIYTVETTNPNLNNNLLPVCKFTICPPYATDGLAESQLKEATFPTNYNNTRDTHKRGLTKVLISTITGEIGLIGWYGSDADKSSSTHKSEKCKHVWWNLVHDDQVSSLNRNIFYPNIILSAGGKILALWNITYKDFPIWSKEFSSNIIDACFIADHPTIIKVALEDGGIETWDVTRNIHKPIWKLETSRCRHNPIAVSVPVPSLPGIDLLVVDNDANIQLLRIKYKDESGLKNQTIREAGVFFKNATLAKIQLTEYNKLISAPKMEFRKNLRNAGDFLSVSEQLQEVNRPSNDDFIRARFVKLTKTWNNSNRNNADKYGGAKMSGSIKKIRKIPILSARDKKSSDELAARAFDPNELYDILYGEIDVIMSCLFMTDKMTEETNKSSDPEKEKISAEKLSVIEREIISVYADDYVRLKQEVLKSMENEKLDSTANIDEIRRKYLSY